MITAGPSITSKTNLSLTSFLTAGSAHSGALVTRDERSSLQGSQRRTRLWEFNTNLHCSIIGTCLATTDLRRILKKIGIVAPESTDHDLHAAAVGLAGKHDQPAKLLNKALDERHRLAINQFSRAKTEEELESLWREAVRRGEIPGAYWATLTHPAATQAHVREAFGEVHMLSHLIGAANRADIRRLCLLEAENADLRARLDRQQAALHNAALKRDATIRALREALGQRISAEAPAPSNGPILGQLVSDLERRLAIQTRRNAVLEDKLNSAKAAVTAERSARAEAERDNRSLRHEIDVIEESLRSDYADTQSSANPMSRLDGITLLYIGGRPNEITYLRALTARLGAVLLHHDGGVEHHLNLLAGLVSRADLVAFPVACISHHAAQAAKQLCRQTDKRFIPVRSTGASSLLAALRRPEVAALADAACRSDPDHHVGRFDDGDRLHTRL